LLDAEDLSLLDGPVCIKIKLRKKGYPSFVADLWTSKKPSKRIGYLSRLVMNAPEGTMVDHINHDTLDNRKVNLRICSRAQNAMNMRRQRQSRSRFKGVYFHDAKRYKPNASGAKPWRAYARIAQRRVWLGYYATEEEAAIAYDRYAREAFGEFACLNMPNSATCLKGKE
jgi:hypothetical protein